jgi:hypothetical protein
VVVPLRVLRQRLKTGPAPAPIPATDELRRKVQAVEIEAELIELLELAGSLRRWTGCGRRETQQRVPSRRWRWSCGRIAMAKPTARTTVH